MAWLQWWDTDRASSAVPARLSLLPKLSAHEPDGRGGMTTLKEADKAPTARSDVDDRGTAGWPTAREGQGHRVLVVVVGVTPYQGNRESRSQGEGAQVSAVNWREGVRDARGRTRRGPDRESGRQALESAMQ
ncbi:MAG: hypothetical protein NVS2B16_27230 [Chloroflexota bacterium]